MQNQTDNPMHSKAWAMLQASRCGARTRSGRPCQSPAMPNGRCRMHGGPSPGAPKGNRNAWKHGARSASTMGAAAWIKAMARLVDGEEA
ncbi:HGGxSTG domain-containing protein [Novosphingobium sp. Gsoil 351]|uniref:HGGxSTG domain-containing protein n=1 Tax=Novosphingobium sp. Gsoil 351 TaxID=2675225 RepID=UPI00351B4C65